MSAIIGFALAAVSPKAFQYMPATTCFAGVILLGCRMATMIYRMRLRLFGCSESRNACVMVPEVDSIDFSAEWPDWIVLRIRHDAALIRPTCKRSETAMLFVPGMGRGFTAMPLQSSIKEILNRDDCEVMPDVCGLEFPWYGAFFNHQSSLCPFLSNEWDFATVVSCVDDAVDKLLDEFKKVIVISNSSSAMCLLDSLCAKKQASHRGLSAALAKQSASLVLTNPTLCFFDNPVRHLCDMPWLSAVLVFLVKLLGCGALVVSCDSDRNWFYYVRGNEHNGLKACFLKSRQVLAGRPSVELFRNPKRLSVILMYIASIIKFTSVGHISLPEAYRSTVRVAITKKQELEDHIDVARTEEICREAGVRTFSCGAHEPELHNDNSEFASYLKVVLEID